MHRRPLLRRMYERAEFAKELGQPIIMPRLHTGGFTANNRSVARVVPQERHAPAAFTVPCTR